MMRRLMTGVLALVIVGLLAGCGGPTTPAGVPAEQEVPAVVQAEKTIVAEAVIEPARWSELRFDIGGDVAEAVEEGDTVAAGDVLVRLETTDLERAVARAELSLRQAQLRLKRLQEPPDEADVEKSRAAVSDAAAAYEEARMNLRLTEHSISVGDAVRAARFARDEAFRHYQHLRAHFDEKDSKVVAAHDAYLNALGAYNRAVENAELELTAARNRVTRAYRALQQARNNLERLLEGADEEDIEAAQLEVKAAQLALEEARSNLEKATLIAPFDGVVTRVTVKPGDAVMPGQVVVVLATLDRFRARTTDLTELDVARVSEGQAAVVTVDALPNVELRGHVAHIDLRSVDYRGDVTYPVYIELAEGAPGLRWGMTAIVKIETK